MRKRIIIIIILLLITFTVYKLIININLKTSINNMIKYADINMTTNIELYINDFNNKSNIDYEITKSNNIYKIDYKTYENNNIISTVNKYYIIDENIYEYNLINKKWNKEKVEKFDKMFNIDYKLLKKTLKHIKYKGNNTYTARIKAYKAYNFIYGKNILTNRDNNKYININIKTDKNNLITKISYDINNLNMEENKNVKINYKVKILNKNINNVKSIKLPK